MLVDAQSVEKGTRLRAGICIIGAGPAGITLARELERWKLPVLVLESGGFEPDAATQKLYEGESRGPILGRNDSYTSSSRLRYFGGTTNHWLGWCRPLDPLDFEARPWVSHSGWPITRAELEPYYRRAANVLEIDPFDDDAHERLTGEPTLGAGGPDSPIVTRRFQLSPPTRFGATYRRELVDSPTTTLMINANAVDIRSNDSASRVEQLEVARLDGSRFTIESRTVVLAAGGIENPRLLLASDGVQRGGLGNQHDLVGRYFSDHPHLVAGHVVLTDPAPSLEVYRLRPPQPVAVLSVSEAVQRAERLLNLRVHLAPVPVEASELTRDVPGVASRIDGYGADTDAAGRGVRFRLLDVSCESTPNPSSRVRLSDERDALGMRRVVVDWQQDPRDHDSVARSVEIIGRTLGRESQGRVRVIPREAPWSHAWEGNHHLGTTRMHLDAKQGVVDEHCRVRGIANLYVAGSSVFPAFGFANPTFTIVALAIRLAEHLRSRAADA